MWWASLSDLKPLYRRIFNFIIWVKSQMLMTLIQISLPPFFFPVPYHLISSHGVFLYQSNNCVFLSKFVFGCNQVIYRRFLPFFLISHLFMFMRVFSLFCAFATLIIFSSTEAVDARWISKEKQGVLSIVQDFLYSYFSNFLFSFNGFLFWVN